MATCIGTVDCERTLNFATCSQYCAGCPLIEKEKQESIRAQELETAAGLNYCFGCLRTLNFKTDSYITCHRCGAHMCGACSRCVCDVVPLD
jgi:hypothetical protein